MVKSKRKYHRKRKSTGIMSRLFKKHKSSTRHKRKFSRRHRKRLSTRHRRRFSRRHRRRLSTRHKKRLSRRHRRKFSRRHRRFGMNAGDGMGGMGPGYAGQTSFQNGYANYFGAKEPFVNASEWWYAGGPAPSLIGQGKSNYQSPNMIYRY